MSMCCRVAVKHLPVQNELVLQKALPGREQLMGEGDTSCPFHSLAHLASASL